MFGLFNGEYLALAMNQAEQCRREMGSREEWKDARKQGFSVRPVLVTWTPPRQPKKRKPK